MTLPRHSKSRPVLAITASALLLALCSCGLLRPGRTFYSRKRTPDERFNAAYRLALAGRYDGAIEELKEIAGRNDARNRYRDDATFWLGYCYQERAEAGDLYEAAVWYGRLLSDFPDSRYVPVARERLGTLKGAGPGG